MRWSIVRLWEVLATALLTAGVADAATEFAGNAGWLGDAVRDRHQESIGPVLLVGASLAVALAVYMLFARFASGDPMLRAVDAIHRRLFDVFGAFSGACALVVMMEAYETRFGGLSPFKAGSVLMAHGVELLLAFVLVAGVVHVMLRSAIQTANRAGRRLACALAQLLRAGDRIAPVRPLWYLPERDIDVSNDASRRARASLGLRAPPRTIPLIATRT